jgi:hypothetical protein
MDSIRSIVAVQVSLVAKLSLDRLYTDGAPVWWRLALVI